MKQDVLTSKRAQLLFIVLAVIEVLLISLMLVTVSEGQKASQQERHYTEQIDTLDNITSILTSSTITLMTQDNAGIAKVVPRIEVSLNMCANQLSRIDIQELKNQPGKNVASLADVVKDLSEIAKTIEAMVVHGDIVDNAILMGNLDGVLLRIQPATENTRTELIKRKAEFADKKDAQFGSLPWLLIASMIIPVIAAFYANYFAFKLSMRMRKIRESVVLISRGDQIHETMSGSDELSELHSTLRELSIAMDRARRKERSMIDNAGEIICSLDSALRLSELNPAVRKLGFNADELLGTNIQSLIHPRDREESHKQLELAKTSGTEISFEARLRTNEGTYVYTSWSATWSPEDRSIFCVVHDITERKRAEQLKQDVLAMVSHDLRAPLTSIGVVLDMVIEGAAGELNDRGERLVGRAQAAVGSLISMIKDLLDIERAEAGGLALTMEVTNAKELITKSLDVIRPEAERKKTALKVTCEDITFSCDSERISRVIVNLVNNALKFSPEGKTVFVVGKLLRHRNVPTEVEFQVIDEGPGIPKEKLDSIFEKFTQVGTGSEGEKMGSGLGLAICKTLVEAHQGKIGVNSTVGEGTTFWFHIPYKTTVISVLLFILLGTFQSPGTAALAAPSTQAVPRASAPNNSPARNSGDTSAPIGSSLRVLEPTKLMPVSSQPDTVNDKRLYDYLLRFAKCLDLFVQKDVKKSGALCDGIIKDLEQSGDLTRSAKDAAQDNYRLMKDYAITPLLRSNNSCGTLYRRLYIETLEMRGNTKRTSDPKGALKDLNRVVEMCPAYAHGRVRLGAAYLGLNQLDKALEQANIAIKYDGTMHEAYFLRARIFEQMNKIEEERSNLEKANILASQETVRLRKFINSKTPEDPSSSVALSDSAKFVLNNSRSSRAIADHGNSLADVGAFKEAQKLGAIAMAVESHEVYGFELKAYVEELTGQFEAAIKDATEALRYFDGDPELHRSRGVSYLHLGRLNEALADFSEIINVVPPEDDPFINSDAHSYRANIYLVQGDYKRALSDANVSVQLNPENSEGHNARGAALARLGRFEESCQEFEKAVALDRKYRGAVTAQVLVNLGQQYQTIGNIDRAIKNYDLALLSDPMLAVKMFSQAASGAQHGTRDSDIKSALSTGKMPQRPFVNQLGVSESRTLLERTVALAPRKREARYNSALASICLNLNKDAAEQLEMFLQSRSAWTDRASVLLYLCRHRLGQEKLGKQELEAYLPRLRDPVIKALAKFFVGQGTESAIFNAAKDTASSTLANSYLGHYYQSKNDTARAKNYIGATLQHGQRMTIEYVIALAELERICGIKYDARVLSR